MGREVVKAVTAADGMSVVAAVDTANIGADAGEIAGIPSTGIKISDNLATAIKLSDAEIIVDFTRPDVIMSNLRIAVPLKVAAVVGTTGITAENKAELEKISSESGSQIFIAPNFAIGAVLMMEFAKKAVKYFDYAEVIEYHHEKKLDAPSGTALRTAEMMKDVVTGRLDEVANKEHGEESRGMAVGNIRVHAIRMPGYVANQEVIFGGLGQTLTIKHDTINRESFMPGVVLAINKVKSLKGVVVGLENIM
jgi:4-hydroxy-tetrahydrodipicolinate reductase